MVATKTPVFLLVPGAWHKPSTYSKLSHFLESNEYESVSIALPSTGSVPAAKSTEQDVQVVRKAIEDIVSTGRDVILVCHSYGGIPTSEACRYFTDEKEGRGAIRGIIFVCAYAVPPGSKVGRDETEDLGPGAHIEGEYAVVNDPTTLFYNDLPADEAAAAVAALKSFSIRKESPLTTFSACSKFPSWYIIGERDNAIAPAVSEAMINGLKELYPGAFNVVERMDTGHSPFLSQPENLGRILIRAAREL